MGNCYNSTVVSAPVERVWATIKDFNDMSWAPDVVNSLETVGGKHGTEVGAQRILNGVFHETLQAFDEGARTFAYSIDDGPGPVARSSVTNYRGVVRLSPVTDDGSTFVEWSSTFESAAEGEVADFCNPIYAALLGALKSHLS